MIFHDALFETEPESQKSLGNMTVSCVMLYGEGGMAGRLMESLCPNVKEQASCKGEQRNGLSFTICGLLRKFGYSLTVNLDRLIPTSH